MNLAVASERGLPPCGDRGYVSGCRVRPQGLHLGHLYGCFVGVSATEPLVFVLSDLHSGKSWSDAASMRASLLDSLAILDAWNLVNACVVRESVLRPLLRPLLTAIIAVASLRDLASTHPLGHAFAKRDTAIALDDFLFPCHQAAYMLGLGARFAAYNEDNAPYIHFARRVARKILARGAPVHCDLEIVKRRHGNFIGWDGKRTSFQNGNWLGVSASHPQCWRYAQQMVKSASGNAFECLEDLASGVLELAPAMSSKRHEQLLGDRLWTFLEPIRAARARIERDVGSPEARLLAFERVVCKRLAETLRGWGGV